MLNFFKYSLLAVIVLLIGCSDEPLNSPYDKSNNDNIFYSSFQERPKHCTKCRTKEDVC